MAGWMKVVIMAEFCAEMLVNIIILPIYVEFIPDVLHCSLNYVY